MQLCLFLFILDPHDSEPFAFRAGKEVPAADHLGFLIPVPFQYYFRGLGVKRVLQLPAPIQVAFLLVAVAAAGFVIPDFIFDARQTDRSGRCAPEVESPSHPAGRFPPGP